LLPHVSTLVVGLEEAAFLTGLDAPRPAAEALLGQGIRRVALKLGGKGGLLLGRKTEPGRRTEPGQDIMPGLECVELPVFTVRSIDTTGAGDSFCAGLIYGQLHGLDLAATGRLAAALGALATTVQGAGLALPGRDGVEALLGQPVGPAR
jgi:ribokinase